MMATLTESARLSSSWPSIELLLRQRATFPSRRSKMAPKRGNQSAVHACLGSDVMRYLAEANRDCAPQKPFMRVNASAR